MIAETLSASVASSPDSLTRSSAPRPRRGLAPRPLLLYARPTALAMAPPFSSFWICPCFPLPLPLVLPSPSSSSPPAPFETSYGARGHCKFLMPCGLGRTTVDIDFGVFWERENPIWQQLLCGFLSILAYRKFHTDFYHIKFTVWQYCCGTATLNALD